MSANSRYRLRRVPVTGSYVRGGFCRVGRGATQRSLAESIVLRVLTFPGMDFPGMRCPRTQESNSIEFYLYDAIPTEKVAISKAALRAPIPRDEPSSSIIKKSKSKSVREEFRSTTKSS